MVAKLLYYVGVNLDLVVATRKSFDVTSMYKSLFHRKCTVQLLTICKYMFLAP